ncbi:MAG: fatty acid desaturase [Verrucomicrobiaceae bacterium]
MSETTASTAIPNHLNLAILLSQLIAVAACLWVASWVESGWAIAALAAVFGIVMNSVYSIIHEAEHAMLFSNRRWNDFAGAFMALFFPAPFHLIRQGHLGHHLRNRSDDEAFDFYFEDDHKAWRILVWYGILTGFFWVIVVLSNLVFLLLPFKEDKQYWQVGRASTAFMEALNPAYSRFIRLECAAAIALHVTLVWLLQIPFGNYLIMYAGFGFMWSAMQYVHHFGTERHVTRGARNLWIWGPLDLLWLNHNWHLTHHQHPSVPWIHLPPTDAEGDTRRGFLFTTYLKMWRGPRLAPDRVANKSAGKIIP